MKHHIIYLPGLGDGYNGFRRTVLSAWRLYGVTVEYIPMNWYKGGSYESREATVRRAIAAAKKQGKTVSLVSESAGGAIALNLFSEDSELYRLVSICAVNNPDTPVSPRIYARSPSFHGAVKKLATTLPKINETRRQSIVVLTSLYDGTVKAADSKIVGARSHTIFALGHIIAIATTIMFYGYWVTRFITRP